MRNFQKRYSNFWHCSIKIARPKSTVSSSSTSFSFNLALLITFNENFLSFFINNANKNHKTTYFFFPSFLQYLTVATCLPPPLQIVSHSLHYPFSPILHPIHLTSTSPPSIFSRLNHHPLPISLSHFLERIFSTIHFFQRLLLTKTKKTIITVCSHF